MEVNIYVCRFDGYCSLWLEMAAAAIAVGLHRLPEYGPSGATAASEYKRRQFSSVYALERVACIMTGTPPLLNRLYCSQHLPLELSSEELFLPRDQLTLTITKLDRNGWRISTNSSDIVDNITLSRCLLLMSQIREEILELSLGLDIVLSPSRIESVFLVSPRSPTV